MSPAEVSTPVRVAGFVVLVAAAFAAAVGVGHAVGPVEEPEPAAHADDGHAADEPGGHGGGHDAEAVGLPGGLAVSEGGYTLRLADPTASAGRGVPLHFSLEGPDGARVTAYDVEHGKRLHLIAVRRDLTGYQHVHPVLGGDGTWRTRLDLTPGDWRVFADFNPTGGVGTTLGADLSVAGDYRPAGRMPETRTARVDGYEVTLTGDLVPGEESPVAVTVTRGGEPVTDLQPYLGAYGHLVALREGDLAYLHVHPDGEPGDGSTEPGPTVEFAVEVPSDADYRLFLDFRHAGVVRTAELALGSHEEHR